MKVLKTERLENGNLLISIPVNAMERRVGNGTVFIAPENIENDDRRNDLLLAIARGRRWQMLLDTKQAASASEIARITGRSPSNVAMHIRMAMLAPQLVEGLMKGDYSRKLTFGNMRKGLPKLWSEQIEFFKM